MNNQEDRNVSKAWVSLQYAERNSPEFDSLFWAHTRRNLGASSRCDLNMGIGKTITHTVDADTPLSADEQAMLVRLRLIANVSLSQLRKTPPERGLQYGARWELHQSDQLSRVRTFRHA